MPEGVNSSSNDASIADSLDVKQHIVEKSGRELPLLLDVAQGMHILWSTSWSGISPRRNLFAVIGYELFNEPDGKRPKQNGV